MTVTLIFLFIVVSYLLPSIIGYARGLEERRLLAAVNVLTGWSGVGYFACLVYAIFVSR